MSATFTTIQPHKILVIINAFLFQKKTQIFNPIKNKTQLYETEVHHHPCAIFLPYLL